jgi:alpha-glucosidase (family GH31 glycosyl hydrolase)
MNTRCNQVVSHLRFSRAACGCPSGKVAGLFIGALAIVIAAGETRTSDASTAIIKGKVRFQALAPGLLRIEYSPKARFVDEASVAVVGRRSLPGATVTTQENDGWLSISTAKISVRYKLDSGPFSAANLRITWKDSSGEHAWKPGDVDDQNLGGVPGQLDSMSKATVIGPVTAAGPLSRSGYYLLDDSRSPLWDKTVDWVKPRPEKGSQDWYFLVYGNDYAAALGTLAKLIGPVPMMPRYVFGAWFGSRACYSAEQWRMIVDQFRDGGFPLDVLVLDSYSTTKVIWGGYDWDYEQMPDPKGFFDWANRRHVKVSVNEHYRPLTRGNDSNFDAIRKAMGLPEGTKEIRHDLADKKYASLFMDLLHKPALDMGMAFWWQDMVAPTTIKGLDSCLWTRHVEYVGSERITGKRTTAFCRLGNGVGSHRYGVYFTGDLKGSWELLQQLIPPTVRGGNQLVPYMNNLCGGVLTADLPVELYRRSVQFGAFSPILWFHGVFGLRMPWEYGQAGEETYRTFVGLRYQLLPYIYSYSRVAHDTGLPLLRGMYLEYPDQKKAYAGDQQYLFGRELLVAPVTKPGNGQPVKVDVFLPAGDDWFDFFTGDLYEGGRNIVHECPISRMPVFVRAGSIVPMGPKMDYSDQAPADPLTLEVYAGKRVAAYTLYEDDGISLDYRKGAHASTTFALQPATESDEYQLAIGPVKGSFAGQSKQRRYVIQVHGLLKPKGVAVNAAALPEILPDGCGPGWTWNAAKRTTSIHLPGAISNRERTVVTIQGAGTFADAIVLQKAISLREQVRAAKRLMKIKHAALLGLADIKKPPRVIRKTEEVERELTAIIDAPSRIGGSTPDFLAMRQRVVAALKDKPFESDRRIPEADPLAVAGTKQIENAAFTAKEIDQIVRLLRGADLPPWLFNPL